MARLSAKLRSLAFDLGQRRTGVAFWCPGCGESHAVCTSGDGSGGLAWVWDGSVDAPTLSPSILVRYRDRVCHSFVRAGAVEFLGDCTHAMAGQRVPLPDWPLDGDERDSYLRPPHGLTQPSR